MSTPPSPSKIYLALPSYDGTYRTGALVGSLNASRHHDVQALPGGGSLLPKCFNQHWATAVSAGKWDLFVMLHADIWPEPFFVDKLVHLLAHHQADVVSCMVPMKDSRSIYSTSMWLPGNLEPHYRLGDEDKRNLPGTFSSEHVNRIIGVQGQLLVNTGCWIARLRQPWNKQVWFEFTDSIDWDWEGTGEAKVVNVAEDWNFSKKLHSLGCTVLATQEIAIDHHGNTKWQGRNLSGTG